MNIVYKPLPLLNIAPLTRQKLNYALDRLQTGHRAEVGRIRNALVALADNPGGLDQAGAAYPIEVCGKRGQFLHAPRLDPRCDIA